MKFKKFFLNNISSFTRNNRKKKLINKIITANQFNNDVINTHRIDDNNVGDFYCAPHLYFKELRNKQLDIYDFKEEDELVRENWKNKIINNALIIGGGGLLNRGSFEKQLKLFEMLAKKGKKTVLWGVGHNAKSKNQFHKNINYNVNINSFGVAGTRDYTNRGDWVPCVSCMHTIFDNSFEEKHEIGIVFHKKTLKNKNLIKRLQKYPVSSNTTDLENLIKFIGSCRAIVTDSYHAMYWSMLLEKKVVVIPNSSKFFDFKYQPVISTFNTFENDMKKAIAYNGLLEECRSINIDFSKKVFEYLII